VLTSGGSVCGALFSQYVLFPGLMKFYGAFNSPRMKFMPGVEDTVDLYLKMMIGMIVVFQIPTVVFFLAKMRLVTARFLWRHLQYAILHHLHPRGGRHTGWQPVEPGGRRGADDRPLPGEHRAGLAGGARAAEAGRD
jgi:hypothetical protein